MYPKGEISSPDFCFAVAGKREISTIPSDASNATRRDQVKGKVSTVLIEEDACQPCRAGIEK